MLKEYVSQPTPVTEDGMDINVSTLGMLGKFFSRRHFDNFFLFFCPVIRVDVSCKLSS